MGRGINSNPIPTIFNGVGIWTGRLNCAKFDQKTLKFAASRLNRREQNGQPD